MAGLALLHLHCQFYALIHYGQGLLTGYTQGIEAPCCDKVFYRPFVNMGQVNPLAEIKQGVKRTLFTTFNYIFNYINTHILNSSQAKADFTSGHGKVLIAFIDIGRKNLNPHFLAFFKIEYYPILVVNHTA